MASHTSNKRIQINKATTMMIIGVAIAAFLVTMSLVSSKALLNKRAYQSRVIKDKEVAAKQLKENIKAVDSLVVSYKAFTSTSDNIIGGNPSGTGERDGDNARIVLDALPSKYDFPALASSLEKILTSKNYKIENINGTDDEVGQSDKASSTPEVVEMPFDVGVVTSNDGARELMTLFELSIRPIKIQTLELSGSNSDLTVSATATTYYQPEKTLNIETKVVK